MPRPDLRKSIEGLKKATQGLQYLRTGVERFRAGVQDVASTLRVEGAPTVEQLPVLREESLPPVRETARRGTACLPCVKDHLSTIGGALSEAARFARSEGIRSSEARKRFDIAEEEINISERIDLHPSLVATLSAEEREVAHWVLPEMRSLRHEVQRIGSVEDLERVSAATLELKRQLAERMEACVPCGAAEELKSFLERKKREKRG